MDFFLRLLTEDLSSVLRDFLREELLMHDVKALWLCYTCTRSLQGLGNRSQSLLLNLNLSYFES